MVRAAKVHSGTYDIAPVSTFILARIVLPSLLFDCPGVDGVDGAGGESGENFPGPKPISILLRLSAAAGDLPKSIMAAASLRPVVTSATPLDIIELTDDTIGPNIL